MLTAVTKSEKSPATPLDGLLDRLGPASGPDAGASVKDVLRAVQVPNTRLQAASPVHESLEWRLSALYWQRAGLSPFLSNSVPYLINNSGRLSENAAWLLFENLRERPPARGAIELVELGAGSGLFAKLFLDAFRELCRAHGEDFYDRLTYVVSDHSPRSVERWGELGMFREHAEHVSAAQVDALDPTVALLADGRTRQLGPARALFCNYVLDVLPATVWRRNAATIEELVVSSHLVEAGERLRAFTELGMDQLRALAAQREASSELLPLVPLLEIEAAFAPARPLPRWGDDAQALLQGLPDGDRLAVHFGALDCLERWGRQLDDAGLMLINDYGSVDTSDTLRQTSPQRFGPTVAIGLNFPLLERCLSRLGFLVVAAPDDAARGIHTRMISRQDLPRTRGALLARFSEEFGRRLDAPVLAAREHVGAGRQGEALDAYRGALECTANDWQLLGEVAEFVGLVVRDHQAGVQIARRAVEINPWTSAWLWNVLGDCLFYLERFSDAHEAFLAAERVDATDARAQLNLSHTFAWLGRYDAALAAIAKGLSHDAGAYRSRLLQQQEQLLGAIAARRTSEHERLVRRLEKLGAA